MNDESLQPGSGYQLPPEAYFDPGWLEAERNLLFPANWSFVCTTADVPVPGEYFCTLIGRYPIVVIRNQSGDLKAFHNICRHRGARLLEDSGNCSKITCPYHRWQYSLDGALENSPQAAKEIPGLIKEQWSLKPVALETWMGMIFVNPDGNAASLNEWLGGLRDNLDVFNLEELTELARCEYTFEANWKFYIENHIDWYHLWYTHSKTLSMLDHS